MATNHPFPPRRASLYAPLVSGARPVDYLDEAEFAKRLDIFDARKKAEALDRAGFRLTLWERLGLDGTSFAAGFVCGCVAVLVLLIAPFVLGGL